MAIDWNKPIRRKNGKALRFLCELQSTSAKYPVVCVATSDDGNEYLVTYTKDGLCNRDNKRESPYDAENIPDSEPAHTEIDWTVDVQVRFKNDDPNAWTDVIIVYHDEQVALGWEVGTGPRHVLLFSLETNEFRNKPAEPKPVQAILKLWRSALDHTLVISAYLKNDFVTVESIRRGHRASEGKLLSVVEIDLHEGEGLEDEK